MSDLRTVIQERFGGKLVEGCHQPNSKACLHEAIAAAMGLPWTDSPEETRCFDMRPLNDGLWPSDEERTEQRHDRDHIRRADRHALAMGWVIRRGRRLVCAGHQR